MGGHIGHALNPFNAAKDALNPRNAIRHWVDPLGSDISKLRGNTGGNPLDPAGLVTGTDADRAKAKLKTQAKQTARGKLLYPNWYGPEGPPGGPGGGGYGAQDPKTGNYVVDGKPWSATGPYGMNGLDRGAGSIPPRPVATPGHSRAGDMQQWDLRFGGDAMGGQTAAPVAAVGQRMGKGGAGSLGNGLKNAYGSPAWQNRRGRIGKGGPRMGIPSGEMPGQALNSGQVPTPYQPPTAQTQALGDQQNPANQQLNPNVMQTIAGLLGGQR